MQADFMDAFSRHLQDADVLFQNGRWANADHLYGMASECALKRLMIIFGMQTHAPTGGPADGEDRKHIDVIWARYESYRSGHAKGPGYILSAVNPFLNWHISDRYAPQSNFDQHRTQSHQNATQEIGKLIKKAQREGLL